MGDDALQAVRVAYLAPFGGAMRRWEMPRAELALMRLLSERETLAALMEAK
jgi:hypothetical protein